MKPTTRLHIPDMPRSLQAAAKEAAMNAGITLKDWVKIAIQEKLDQKTYKDSDYETDQFGRRHLKK